MAESAAVDNEFVVEDALAFLDGNAPFMMSQGMAVHVYSNEPYNPAPYGLLDLFYRQVFGNKVALIMAKHATSGDIFPVLAFVEPGDEEGEVRLYPIARLLTEAEVPEYLSPRGDGEYFSYDDSDSAE